MPQPVAAPTGLARALHQHDLTAAAAARLVQLAQIKPDERVVEPGAGTGALTAALLAARARVWAVELDPRRCDTLRARCGDALADGRLHIVLADAVREPVDPGGAWRVLGNPPFNMTAALLRRWLLDDHPAGPPGAIDLLLQRQAAEKCCASRWGGHTRTSVLLHLWGGARTGAGFPRDATEPPSHVPLVAFHARRSRTAPGPDRLRAVDRLLEAAFAGPHTVRDALRGVIPGKILGRLGPALGFDPAAHPRMVPPTAWLELARG
jgi:23S rRNA (adenine-N6)-dimethyltransferase